MRTDTPAIQLAVYVGTSIVVMGLIIIAIGIMEIVFEGLPDTLNQNIPESDRTVLMIGYMGGVIISLLLFCLAGEIALLTLIDYEARYGDKE